jgi:hypothetical protein
MPKEKPACETVFPWLRANLGKGITAQLTGTDVRALKAAVMLVELYCYTGDTRLTDAFRPIVENMQPKTRELAYHAIAHVMNWSDRARLWDLASLKPIEKPMLCQWEPAGINRAIRNLKSEI